MVKLGLARLKFSSTIEQKSHLVNLKIQDYFSLSSRAKYGTVQKPYNNNTLLILNIIKCININIIIIIINHTHVHCSSNTIYTQIAQCQDSTYFKTHSSIKWIIMNLFI